MLGLAWVRLGLAGRGLQGEWLGWGSEAAGWVSWVAELGGGCPIRWHFPSLGGG